MFDVAVFGGSFAGLTAALQRGRAGRSVALIDAGVPRNRTSPAGHGVAGRDGVAPRQILARFRVDLDACPAVQHREGKVARVLGVPDAFDVALEVSGGIAARRIVLAHGVRDVLPDVPGLAEAWGRHVLHCPYCHGYEVKGEPLAVLATHTMSAHRARMPRANWSDRVTLIAPGLADLDLNALRAAGVQVETRSLEAASADDSGIDLSLTGGATLRFGALFLGPRTTLAQSPAEHLGCALAEGPMGPFVKVGPMAQTSLAGVFAAVDVAGAMPNINPALADVAQAGAACHASRLFPDFVTPLELAA